MCQFLENQLCWVKEQGNLPECYEAWMAGKNISLRDEGRHAADVRGYGRASHGTLNLAQPRLAPYREGSAKYAA
jgi:hypothetical protein